jgi:hypothetical protein
MNKTSILYDHTLVTIQWYDSIIRMICTSSLTGQKIFLHPSGNHVSSTSSSRLIAVSVRTKRSARPPI